MQDKRDLTAEEEKEIEAHWLYFKAMTPGGTARDRALAWVAYMELAADADDQGMPLLARYRIDRANKLMGGSEKVKEMMAKINEATR